MLHVWRKKKKWKFYLWRKSASDFYVWEKFANFDAVLKQSNFNFFFLMTKQSEQQWLSSSNISRWRSQVICSESNRLKIKLFPLISSTSSSSSHRFFFFSRVFMKNWSSLYSSSMLFMLLSISTSLINGLFSLCCLHAAASEIYLTV